MEYARVIFGLLVSAIGNRQWGAGIDKGYPAWLYSKYLAVVTMTLGIIITAPEIYALWSPAIAALVLLFRVKGTGASFLATEKDTAALHDAVVRGMYAAPLGLLLAGIAYWHDGDVAGHLIGVVLTPAIGLAYYIFGRIWPAKATELAELFGGAYLALMAALRRGQ
jgi:hypothetical protein